MITKSDALCKLCPNGGWIQDGDTTIWLDGYDPVSEEEIVQKVAELEYQEEVNEYQRQRAAEYPSIADQQDMQFHDAVNGTTTWKDAIQAVKDKYPKKKMNTTTLNKRKKDALAKLKETNNK